MHSVWVAYDGVAPEVEVELDGTRAMEGDVATRLARIDSVTRAVAREVALEPADRIRALSFGEGALWATTGLGVLRIDPVSLEIIARVDVRHVSGIVAGAGSAWAAGKWGIHLRDFPRGGPAIVGTPAPADRRVVYRINPTTRALVATIALGFVPSSIATFGNQVWAISEWASEKSELICIDAVANAVASRIPLDQSIQHVTAGEGAIFVASQRMEQGCAVLRVDPATHSIERISLDGPDHDAMRVLAAHGALWVSGEKHAPLLHVDLGSRRVSELKNSPYGTGIPMELAANADGVWITFADANRVLHIDPGRREVDVEVPLRAPLAIASA
jgi:hypothetical protein